MTTSQVAMVLALAIICVAWIVSWFRGHRARHIQHVFGSLCVQTLAAVFLSRSSDHLLLSIAFAAVILGAIGWMIWNGSPRIQAR
ncbi:MAG TPA: hypothetical protein VEH04_07340 [Verrucomicrobiae bacterium]|nr:hypothetical protein [Verrucomicrobiae bacterium]